MDKIHKPDRPESLSTVQEVHDYLNSLVADGKIPYYVQVELTRMIDSIARIDHLTGCLNGAGFKAEIRRAVDMTHSNRRQSRQADWLCLWLMDLHRFKNINDIMGHLAGDRVLEVVGQTLLKSIRHKQGVDFAARPGGDEFGALLTEVTSVEGVLRRAERFKKAVEEYKDWEKIDERLLHMFPVPDIGCAFLHTEALHSIQSGEEIELVCRQWYDRADNLSYESKQHDSLVFSRIYEYDRESRSLVESRDKYFRQALIQKP